MATHTDGVVQSDFESTGDPIHQTRKTAMWIWLGSEAFFFGAMIATFLLYRNTTDGGPGSEIFNIPVHVGQHIRAAHELAHDGAGRQLVPAS